MKNYLAAAALLAAGTAFANAATPITFTDSASTNYNITMHGFQFSLSAMSTTETVEAGMEFTLDSLSIRNPGSNTGVGVTFALLVLDMSSNNVLGYTTGTSTTVKNENTSNTFDSFTSVGGGDLILTYDATYRFLTVSADVVSAITDAGDEIASFIYDAGGTQAVQTTIVGDVMTISQGLVAPGARGHWASDAVNCAITGSNGTSLGSFASGDTSNPVGSFVTSVTATAIPEPSAFGLLAGAGALALVAARRRRRAK